MTRSAISKIFLQPVRDVQDAGPAPLHLTHHREQALDLVVWKDRGGFIEHEHAAAAVPASERSCDRDDRPLDGSRFRERAMDVELDVEALEDPVGLLDLLGPADAAAEPPDEVAAQSEVVHRVQLEHETEVLMDEAQTVRDGVTEGKRFTRELGDGTRVR